MKRGESDGKGLWWCYRSLCAEGRRAGHPAMPAHWVDTARSLMQGQSGLGRGRTIFRAGCRRRTIYGRPGRHVERERGQRYCPGCDGFCLSSARRPIRCLPFAMPFLSRCNQHRTNMALVSRLADALSSLLSCCVCRRRLDAANDPSSFLHIPRRLAGSSLPISAALIREYKRSSILRLRRQGRTKA